MSFNLPRNLRGIAAALIVVGLGTPAAADPMHGIAMYGQPALPPDFVSLPYANADAPQGGSIVLGESGTFDSLNPFIVKGQAAAGVSLLTVETLMGRSYDEPFSLYGVLAESISTDDSRNYVEFTLREGARFSDGSPVTPEDVIWSFEKLGTEGNPRYAAAWKKIATAEKTGDSSVKFTFNVEDRELPLILGLRPILKKAQWEGKDFTESSLEPVIGSGPYIVDKVEAGKYISYKKNPDWWGKDVPFYKGQHNFDAVRYEYFGDAGIVPSRPAPSPPTARAMPPNGCRTTIFRRSVQVMSSSLTSRMAAPRESTGSCSTRANRSLPTGAFATR
jgi:peptide/nickel transport system substrate-binding protein